MSPRTRHDPTLAILGLLLLALGLELIIESRRVAETDERRRIDRNRLLELEQQLDTRSRQLDGALEHITEIKNGVDTDTTTAGE